MEIIFTNSTGLYFYSALLQANAALVAIIGLYTIFRIQSINSIIESIKSSLIAEGSSFRKEVTKFDTMNLNDKKKRVKEVFTDTTGISLAYRRWLKLELLNSDYKKSMVYPAILFGSAIILNAMLLFLSSSIHLYNSTIEIICAAIVLIYEIVLIIIISRKMIQLTLDEQENE